MCKSIIGGCFSWDCYVTNPIGEYLKEEIYVSQFWRLEVSDDGASRVGVL